MAKMLATPEIKQVALNYYNILPFFNEKNITIDENQVYERVNGKPVFPFLNELQRRVKNSISITIIDKKVNIIINTAPIESFFNGNVNGFKEMKFVEDGRKDIEAFFFFTVKMQKRFAEWIKATPADIAAAGLPTDIEEYDRKTKKKSKRRKRVFEIRKGKLGKGVMARWEAFSEKAQRLLINLYGGRRPYYKGYEGLKIKNDFIKWLYDRQRLVNQDNRIIDLINRLIEIREIKSVTAKRGRVIKQKDIEVVAEIQYSDNSKDPIILVFANAIVGKIDKVMNKIRSILGGKR